MMMEYDLYNFEKEKVGTVDLAESIFRIQPRVDVIARVIHWQQARSRSGTHKIKGMGEVSGTTKKPYKQKGTGNARQGSLRAPQFRTGGVVHGPVSRDHGYALPKKVRRLGLTSALSQKLKEGRLLLLDRTNFTGGTKQMSQIMRNLGLTSALIIDSVINQNFIRACRNIPYIDILPPIGVNVYDVMRHDFLVITKSGIDQLTERLS